MRIINSAALIKRIVVGIFLIPCLIFTCALGIGWGIAMDKLFDYFPAEDGTGIEELIDDATEDVGVIYEDDNTKVFSASQKAAAQGGLAAIFIAIFIPIGAFLGVMPIIVGIILLTFFVFIQLRIIKLILKEDRWEPIMMLNLMVFCCCFVAALAYANDPANKASIWAFYVAIAFMVIGIPYSLWFTIVDPKNGTVC